jgi:hypothetical protein
LRPYFNDDFVVFSGMEQRIDGRKMTHEPDIDDTTPHRSDRADIRWGFPNHGCSKYDTALGLSGYGVITPLKGRPGSLGSEGEIRIALRPNDQRRLIEHPLRGV